MTWLIMRVRKQLENQWRNLGRNLVESVAVGLEAPEAPGQQPCPSIAGEGDLADMKEASSEVLFVHEIDRFQQPSFLNVDPNKSTSFD